MTSKPIGRNGLRPWPLAILLAAFVLASTASHHGGLGTRGNRRT